MLTQNMGDPTSFLIPALLAALTYLYFSTRMNRACLESMLTTLREKVFISRSYMETVLKGADKDIIHELESCIQEPDDAIALGYARVLVEGVPESAAKRVPDCSAAKRQDRRRTNAPRTMWRPGWGRQNQMVSM
jgi:hypothetical protein